VSGRGLRSTASRGAGSRVRTLALGIGCLAAASLATTKAHAEPNPRFDYVLYCAGCHLENGGGDPPEVPDLRQDLDTLIRMPEGRSYLARVPGSADAPITDAQLAGVLNWMMATFYPDLRGLRPYTAREIASYRDKPLLDPLKYRAMLLAENPAAAPDNPAPSRR
jgi:cytochrome c peroxidase